MTKQIRIEENGKWKADYKCWCPPSYGGKNCGIGLCFDLQLTN